jgi:GT2 family glycosyltransferase
LRTAQDADMLLRCLVSLWSTQTGADVLVVDDGSPAAELLEPLAAAVGELGFELAVTREHRGVAAACNVGLARARAEARDAVLVHTDVEFVSPAWLAALLRRTDAAGRPAAVVGARLLFPDGDIQDAGRGFSVLTRTWWPRFRHGPGDLPAALEPVSCPVGGALMLIRAATLDAVGVLDEELRLGGSDIDYCLRVFAAGLECVYEPAAVAVHHADDERHRSNEMLQRWARGSAAHLEQKWAQVDLSPFVAEAL